MTDKIVEFLYLGSIMDRLAQTQIANNRALQEDDKNIERMSLKQKLKNDHDILLPVLNDLHKEILTHYEEKTGKKFKFL